MMKTTLTAFALLLPAATIAQAESAAISVTEGFARSSNPKSGAAYMVLTNDGSAACRLAGITTDLAEKAELHTMRDEGGVMKMMPADPLVLEPATSHKLQRGGDHVMLMGLHAPLENGQMVPFTFDFGDCGTLNAEVVVDNVAGVRAGRKAAHEAGHAAGHGAGHGADGADDAGADADHAGH